MVTSAPVLDSRTAYFGRWVHLVDWRRSARREHECNDQDFLPVFFLVLDGHCDGPQKAGSECSCLSSTRNWCFGGNCSMGPNDGNGVGPESLALACGCCSRGRSLLLCARQ